ncbi:MAG TPA: carboxypeptidase regulatory-like domain-containing protein [Oscillatoriaceae cyanobacterium]
MRIALHAILLAGLLLMASCASPPTGVGTSGRVTSKTPSTHATSPSTPATTEPSSSASPTAQAYFGIVLDASGKPVANVAVTGYLLGNNGGGVVANDGSGIVGNNGSSLISDKGTSYKLLSTGLTATTDAQGHFTLSEPQGRPINVEADLSDTEKAIAFNVASDASGVQLQLAPTGSIMGSVTASKAPAVKHFIGVQVFVPGTSYFAATADDGSFVIHNVPKGTYALYATKSGLGNASVGGIEVESNQTASATLDLVVPTPTIASVTPDVAGPGATLRLTGTNFGATDGSTFSVSLGGASVSNPTRLDDHTITLTVPSGASSGNVNVTVNDISSNSKPFTLLSALTLTSPLNGLLVGGHDRLLATGTDATGTIPLAPGTLSWSSDNAAVDVDASGTATGVSAGAATISASSGSLKATFKLNATASAPAVATYQVIAAHAIGGLAYDSAGNLYEADGAQPSLWRITPSGDSTAIYAGAGWGNHVFEGAAVNAQGKIYLSEQDGNRILEVDASGTESVLAGPPDSQVLNANTQQIQGPSGLTNGSGGTVRFDAPQGLVLDGSGNLFVADSGNNCLRKIDAQGTVSTFVTGLAQPVALARDAQGDLLVACAGDDTIRMVTPQGAVSQLATSVGTDSSPFVGVAVAPGGKIYAVCAPVGGVSSTARVYQIGAGGSVTAIAGGNVAANTGAVDGPGSSATFFALSALTMTPDGNLIVGDASPGTGTLREILLQP